MRPLKGRLAACMLAGSLLLVVATAARTLPVSQQPQQAAGGMDTKTLFGDMGRLSRSSKPAPAVVKAKRTAAGASSQQPATTATSTVRQAGGGSGDGSSTGSDYGSGTSYGTPSGYYFPAVPPNPPGSYYYATSGLNFEYDYTYLPLTDRVVFAQNNVGLIGVDIGVEDVAEADPVFAATGASVRAWSLCMVTMHTSWIAMCLAGSTVALLNTTGKVYDYKALQQLCHACSQCPNTLAFANLVLIASTAVSCAGQGTDQ